jgi:hypothetical protein
MGWKEGLSLSFVRRRLEGEVISVPEYKDRGVHVEDRATKIGSSEVVEVVVTEPTGDSTDRLCGVVAFEAAAILVLGFAEYISSSSGNSSTNVEHTN